MLNSFIAWRCFHNKITDENLINRGCIVVSGCAMCLSNVETTSHLFLTSGFATQIWNWLRNLLHMVFCTNTFPELFASLDNNWSPYLLQVANAAIIHALHTIWLARCGIRFNNTKINMHAART
jgi:hypothetical protein